MKRAVFFDRDDTIIKNIPYLGDPQLVEILPHAAETCFELKKMGYELYIVSNQSGVGRGLITEEQVDAVNKEMERQLGQPFFNAYFLSYDQPGDPQAELTRKPSPHLLQMAALEHDIDLSQSIMVGDKDVDVFAGKNAGCRTILVLTGIHDADLTEAKKVADFIAHDMKEVLQCIQSFSVT